MFCLKLSRPVNRSTKRVYKFGRYLVQFTQTSAQPRLVNGTETVERNLSTHASDRHGTRNGAVKPPVVKGALITVRSRSFSKITGLTLQQKASFVLTARSK